MESWQCTLEGVGMTPQFWRSKRIVLTGHTGFKGSWLALWLQRLGAEVAGFALAPPTRQNLFEVAGVGKGMTDVRGDVRDLDAVIAMVAEHRPEIVIHMAAQSLVRNSYVEPVATYGTNVMGTVHVLEAVRRVGGVRALLIVTSDKCYENREWLWGYRESEPMGGFDPYSSSKGCAELVTDAYRRSFFSKGPAVASARAGNVIGGGDWAEDRLIPDVVRAFVAGRAVEIRNPQAIRPWQHVLEPLSGYLTLLERLWSEGQLFAESWNFGPHESDARTVASVVGGLAELWGENAGWQLAAGAHPHEAYHLKLDCAKARTLLGWVPRLPLNQGLAWTAAWYRAWHDHGDLQRVTKEQIERYQKMESS